MSVRPKSSITETVADIDHEHEPSDPLDILAYERVNKREAALDDPTLWEHEEKDDKPT